MVLRAKQYKDKEKLRITRNKQRKRYYNKYNFSKNKRKRYTPEEEIMIEEHSISDRELAKKLHRSVNAIQIKRVKLKEEKS